MLEHNVSKYNKISQRFLKMFSNVPKPIFYKVVFKGFPKFYYHRIYILNCFSFCKISMLILLVLLKT